MDDKIFTSGNKLPPLLTELSEQSTLKAMEPGETTWTVPWALGLDESGAVCINQSMGNRDQKPLGTVTLKLVKDFDGVFVDATALTRKNLEERLISTEKVANGVVGASAGDFIPVGGVLYPDITDDSGLDPKAVKEFNHEQNTVREKFAQYYEKTYGQKYTFAKDETKSPAIPPVSGSLGTVSMRPSVSRSWLRRPRN